MLRAKRHKLAMVLSRVKLTVNGDPDRLVQCVANILTNAAKYTDADGEIRVETFAQGGQAVIQVRDNGVGISPELLPRIFDLFVQADRSLDRTQGGLGIGLSIVKRLVDMHDGSVSVSSEGMGKGSTFQIRLPLTDSVVTDESSSSGASGSSRKILIVDDNEDAANSLGMVLQLQGHDVMAVFSGMQALESAADFGPDLVLLDIGLPGLDGYEVASQLRELPGLAEVIIVAVTGYGQDADREHTAAAGFAAHLVKPLDFAQLRDVIEATR